jgi:hypothetical protein
VAALLNAAHPDVDYPMTEQEVIDAVNDALGGSRSDMLELAAELDELNNLGCPLGEEIVLTAASPVMLIPFLTMPIAGAFAAAKRRSQGLRGDA